MAAWRGRPGSEGSLSACPPAAACSSRSSHGFPGGGRRSRQECVTGALHHGDEPASWRARGKARAPSSAMGVIHHRGLTPAPMAQKHPLEKDK